MEDFFEVLKKYVPINSLPILKKQISTHPFHLKITRKRTSKNGDFMPKINNRPYRISVNGSLNQYAFLITLVHEYAHLLTWEKHKRKVAPHGAEWKCFFRDLMHELLNENIFPEALKKILAKHLINPAASSVRDQDLQKELRLYDPPTKLVFLSELGENTKFVLNNNRIFQKGKKRRTRYLCKELKNNKEYLISGIAEVLPCEV